MPASAKVYSVQPRFKTGDMPGGWALVDSLFRMGTTTQVPIYGTPERDLWLSMMWINEPMTAGVFSTWIEKAQTVNWKITGGRNSARWWADVFNGVDNGLGWAWHEAWCAGDYLFTDKGSCEELGRQNADKLVKFVQGNQGKLPDLAKLDKFTTGKVLGIQHLDAAHLVKVGRPGVMWRYYPEHGIPVDIPDANLIQIANMPIGRDRYRGYGYCSMSRLLDAKQLMLGYLTYFRQEIGDLPPELVVIINGLPATYVGDSLKKYKVDREAAGHSVYSKIWWLGSDDPSTPVSLSVQSLTTPNKAFNYTTMIEWWIKVLALNTGEDVGEFWLLQTGESKTVQSIQHMKAKGKGVARYIAEKERRYNFDVLPYGVRFEYDNTDDEQDAARADILATNIGNLKNLAAVGAERQEFAFSLDEVRKLAVDAGIVESVEIAEASGTVGQPEAAAIGTMGSAFKEMAVGSWVVDRQQMKEYYKPPILKGREAMDALVLYERFKDMYSSVKAAYGVGQEHQILDEVVL